MIFAEIFVEFGGVVGVLVGKLAVAVDEVICPATYVAGRVGVT